jgi:hypothetical protein
MTRRRASAATVEYVATQQFAYERTDGSVHRWHQEDESSVTKREDAIAMLQRTIDFWVPKLARDLQVERNVSAAQAIGADSVEGTVPRQMGDQHGGPDVSV